MHTITSIVSTCPPSGCLINFMIRQLGTVLGVPLFVAIVGSPSSFHQQTRLIIIYPICLIMMWVVDMELP